MNDQLRFVVLGTSYLSTKHASAWEAMGSMPPLGLAAARAFSYESPWS
jgi:hypothetical protein